MLSWAGGNVLFSPGLQLAGMLEFEQCVIHNSYGSFRFPNDTNSLCLPTLEKSQRSSACRDPGHHGKSYQGRGADTAAIIQTFEYLFIMPDLFSHVNCQEWDLKGVDEGGLQTKVISRTSYCTSPHVLLPSHFLSCSSLQSTQQLLAQGNSNKTVHGFVNLLMQLNCWKQSRRVFSLKVLGASRDHLHTGALQWALLTICEHRMKTFLVERDMERERGSAREKTIRKTGCHHPPNPAIIILDSNSHCFHQVLRQKEECGIWPSMCDDISGSLSRSWELLPAR